MRIYPYIYLDRAPPHYKDGFRDKAPPISPSSNVSFPFNVHPNSYRATIDCSVYDAGYDETKRGHEIIFIHMDI